MPPKCKPARFRRIGPQKRTQFTDFRFLVWDRAWIMFCALDLHRRNINRAISDNMLPEIGASRLLSTKPSALTVSPGNGRHEHQ